MDLATFHALLTSAGQAALADAHALAPSEAAFLLCYEKLRKSHEPALAKAALETVLLRQKARVKFAHAERMYFTREALEQATGEAVARYRAVRFAPYGVVADLCCGIGGDALALAVSGLSVHAVESDALRLAMTRVNAAALGLADRITFHDADALRVPLPDIRAAFADPDRRSDGRRHLDPENYAPPLSALREQFAPGFPLGVKIAPGVAWDDVANLGAEVEFVSVDRELKECVLWFGGLRTATRRATLLPAAVTLHADNLPPSLPIETVSAYLFDPDPAVVRAGLAPLLAEQLGVSPIDHTVALFTGSKPLVSPFMTVFHVEFANRFHPGRLRDHLRANGVGRVTVVKRGSMIDADELLRKLRLTGNEHRFVMLTRAAGEQTMIVGERM